MAQPLHLRGHPRRALRGVGPRELVADVEDERLLAGQRGQLVRAGDHPDRGPLGSTRSTPTPPERFRQRRDGRARWRRPAAARRPRPPPGTPCPTNRDRVARRISTHGAPASVPRSCSSCAVRDDGREAERAGERLRALQVRLLELQPRQVGTLITGFAHPSRVLPAQRALLAVQTRVRVSLLDHRRSLRLKHDEIVNMRDASVKCF